MNYTRNMTQTATYWAPGAPDAFGSMSFSAPVTVKCRWQDVAELFRDPNGNELTSSAVVYPVQTLLRQGWLFLGISVATNPRTVVGAHEIRQIGSSPNLSGTLILNKVWL